MPKLKPDTVHAAGLAEYQMEKCLDRLQQAITYARMADAPELYARLRACRKSAAGALNHARHRARRAEAGAPMKRRGIQ